MRESVRGLVPELSVTDWRASRAFYAEVIGFEVGYERPEEGFAFLTLGDAALMIDQIGIGRDFDAGLTRADRPFGRGLNLQAEVPSVDAVLARLGSAPVVPRETRWYRRDGVEHGQVQAVIADPDGYLVRVCEPVASRTARPSGS